MDKWETITVHVAGVRDFYRADLNKRLAEGWEPFSVTAHSSSGFYYHLRRNLGRDVEEAVRDLRDMIS